MANLPDWQQGDTPPPWLGCLLLWALFLCAVAWVILSLAIDLL